MENIDYSNGTFHFRTNPEKGKRYSHESSFVGLMQMLIKKGVLEPKRLIEEMQNQCADLLVESTFETADKVANLVIGKKKV